MRSKVQKVLSTTLIILTLIPLLTLNVSADDGYNGTGGGETGGNEGSEYSWNQNKQGYRISIIDESGKLMGTPVDILYVSVK